jgi:hypothetical protein
MQNMQPTESAMPGFSIGADVEEEAAPAASDSEEVAE